MFHPQRNPEQTTRGRRRHGRLRLRLKARLITIHGTIDGLLLDLSLKGARINLHTPAPGRGDAMLQWDGYEAFGTIVWTKACECGLSFDEPLPETVLLAMRDAAVCPDEREQVRVAAAVFVNGRQGFVSEQRPRVPFGKR